MPVTQQSRSSFVLMLPLPPRSTLFPYTTLFRSVIDIQITLKQMLRDFIGIRVNRAKKIPKRSEERFSRNAETDLVCRLLLEKKKRIVESAICSSRDQQFTVHDHAA